MRRSNFSYRRLIRLKWVYPKFVKKYVNLRKIIKKAVSKYKKSKTKISFQKLEIVTKYYEEFNEENLKKFFKRFLNNKKIIIYSFISLITVVIIYLAWFL